MQPDLVVSTLPVAALGRVDGFDQDEVAGKGDQGCVVLFGFLAAHGDPLEAFYLADELLDAGAQFIEALREEAWFVLDVAAVRNDRADTSAAGGGAVGFGIVAFIGDDSARGHVRADADENGRSTHRLQTGQLPAYESNTEANKLFMTQ